MAARQSDLLSPAFLLQLERLTLKARKPVRGWAAGQRRSRQAGNSVEFLDHRAYGVGDDMRYVDWNIYRRTERLMVKQLVDDEDLCLHLLVDASASMDLDEGPMTTAGTAGVAGNASKLRWASRLAAALGYVGLTGLERVGLGILREHVAEGWKPARGRGRVADLFRFLGGVRAGGATHLNRALADYAARVPESGVVVLISDLLDPDGYSDGLQALLERRFDVHLVHLLSPAEMRPPLDGDLRLVDHETGDRRALRVDAETLRAYEEHLRGFMERIQSFCHARGIGYHHAVSDAALEPFVLGPLRGRLLA